MKRINANNATPSSIRNQRDLSILLHIKTIDDRWRMEIYIKEKGDSFVSKNKRRRWGEERHSTFVPLSTSLVSNDLIRYAGFFSGGVSALDIVERAWILGKRITRRDRSLHPRWASSFSRLPTSLAHPSRGLNKYDGTLLSSRFVARQSNK